MTDLPPLRYLTSADVGAAMPALPERLALAETVLRGLAGDAELPPKIGVHPRPAGSFGHAMPAYLPGEDASGRADRVGMKWVLAVSQNNERGIPAIHATLLLNDPVTGVPTAILDAGPITAERTAATSGVAIRAWAPPVSGRAPRAAVIGAGVQGRSHVPVIGHLLPGVRLAVFDRDPERAEALAAYARTIDGIEEAAAAPDARAAVAGADVVVTAASFVSPPERQVMTADWLGTETLVVPVDYATYCSASVARDAGLFVVDHRDQFLANREAGQFDGYPDPGAMIGEALDATAGMNRPPGRVVATHLGTGLADVVFGSAILAAAEARGIGTVLPR
jgi:ornithine cyclodeaminase/alanine dehydrogenase-like protein (mu-crystallin family)